MSANQRQLGILGLLGLGLVACAAAGPSGESTDDPGSGGDGDASGDGGSLGVGVGGFHGNGGSSSSGPNPADVSCPKVAQEILILDFRSGWWSGGGGGMFREIALQDMVQTCSDISVEYHHFEISVRVKCLFASSGGPGCQELDEPPPSTSDGILALFEKPKWDDYTQIWILSGSELDATDVTLTGELMDHFLAETKGSCIPVLIGAGDGFITHGNAVATELGIGNVFSTEFVQPGFFSVALDPAVTIGAWMNPGTELADHVLFEGVDSIADTVSNSMQATHGDSVAEGNTAYQVIAHDSSGRPAIAVGAIDLPGDGDRPFIIDAGFQRYYGITASEGTRTLLENMVKYLGNTGCKAEIPK